MDSITLLREIATTQTNSLSTLSTLPYTDKIGELEQLHADIDREWYKLFKELWMTGLDDKEEDARLDPRQVAWQAREFVVSEGTSCVSRETILEA
jgi:hypothetical protein